MNDRTKILRLINPNYSGEQLAEDLLMAMTDEQVAKFLEDLGL